MLGDRGQGGVTSRRAWRAILAAAFCAGLAGIPAARADTGPATVSISSTGGFNMCLNNILTGDVFHYFKAVAGTRHPYRAAAYHGDDSVAGLSGQISNDDEWYWNEFTMPTGNIARVRIDNQAAASGNGSYRCRSEDA